MSDEAQWYSNKELFEQIISMREDFSSLRTEMKQTRETIKTYNGLREQLQNSKLENEKELQKIRQELSEMKAKNSGKTTVLTAIREWGGWIVAILMLVINIIQG